MDDFRACRRGSSLHRHIYFDSYGTQENFLGSTMLRLQSQRLNWEIWGLRWSLQLQSCCGMILVSTVKCYFSTGLLLCSLGLRAFISSVFVLFPCLMPQFPNTTQVLLGMKVIIFSQPVLWPSPLLN